jgi:hypothetical protein
MRGWRLVRLVSAGVLLAGAWTAGACASAPDSVRDIAGRKLHCARDDIEVSLNRETRRVREYAAGCNFMYTLVHCTDQGCQPAETEPPCIGNLPCFEEDPETLTWHLASVDGPRR